MNRRDETYLRDMLKEALFALQFMAGKTRESLDEDVLLSHGVVRALEIIGEAASKISDETRAVYSQIPWKSIVGMRNRIVHDYNNVDHDIVWETIILRIPELIQHPEPIIQSLPDTNADE